MEKYFLTDEEIQKFRESEIIKDTIIAYKQNLIENGYAVRSVNSILANLNCLFSFLGWYDCRAKTLKVQLPGGKGIDKN